MCAVKDCVNLYHQLCESIRAYAKASPRCGHYVSALLCAALLLEVPGNAAMPAEKQTADSGTAGLFSWNAETVNKTDGALFKLMKGQGLTALYQNISSKNSRQEQMSAFVESAMDEGITVYHLTGDASWGLDSNGERLCEAVNEAVAYNRRIERKFLARRATDGKPWNTIPKLAGIVFDVEPYTLKEWDRDPEKVMERFVSGMKKHTHWRKDTG